jgi:uncharacterized membrane protein
MTTSRTRRIAAGAGQVALGAFIAFAGVSHLTTARQEFQAQVPAWLPLDPDFVVLASGVAEISLGAALLTAWKQPARGVVGAAAAAFFVAVFPGNIAQFAEHKDAFGLDTDTKRAVRLAFQPLLVAWALGATGAVGTLRSRRRRERAAR